MSASSRLQEDKDVALASSKKLLEKEGLELPQQVDLNIGNKVGDLSSIVGGGVGGLFGSIGGSFDSLVGDTLKSVQNFDISSISDAISGISDGFASALSGLSKGLDTTKEEELNDRVDTQAAVTDPYIDSYDVITYKDFTLMLEDIIARKYADGTVLKYEKTRAYYVAVKGDNGVFYRFTLFNYNKLKKSRKEPLIQPKGSVETNIINGVKIFEGTIKK